MKIPKDISLRFMYPLISMATRFAIIVFCVMLATQKLYAESEPNDNMATATVATIDTNNFGTISDSDKEDWWKLTITEAGNLCLRDSVIESSGPSLSYLYAIYLYDSDGKTEVASDVSRPESNTGTRITTGVLPGIYYVRIRRSGYSGSYKIFPEFTPVSEDTAMNDSLEVAQNMMLNKNNIGNIGHWNVNITDKDKEDWWKITITEAGKLCLRDSVIESSGPSLSYLYAIYLYDSDGKTEVESDVSRPESNSGSRITTGVLPGTYYVRIRRSGYYGSYKIFPEFTAVPEDTVMNDSLEVAQNMTLNKTNFGNIGHWNVNITDKDKEDWWKITITEAGNLCLRDSVIESSGPSLSYLYAIYLYDSDGKTEVESDLSRPESNTGSRITTGVLPGTYYVRIRRSSYYGSYKIFPEFITVPEDTVMNDSLKVAQNMELNKTISGNIGYWNVNITDKDKEDWWKITITEPGNLCLRDSVIESSGPTLSYLYAIYLYYSDGKTEVKSHVSRPESNSGSRITTRVLPGTYYVRIRRSGYYGSYKVFPEFIPAPKSKFVINQDVANVLFSNQSEDGENYQWLFGDGNSSEEANTSHIYDEPGDYKVQLIASNVAGADTSSQMVSLFGVRDFLPKQGGDDGRVTLTVLGGGLNGYTTVKLTREGHNDIEGFDILISSLGEIRATFNLTGKSLGKYKLVVTPQNSGPIESKNTFEIVPAESPKPWVNLSGRSKALFNRWQTYTIEFGNTGNVDAEFVPLFISISNPDENEVVFPDLQIIHNDVIIENGWEQEFEKLPVYFDVETFRGENIKTRIYPLYLYSIPASFVGSLTMKVKTPGQVKISVWNTEPLMENGILKSSAQSELADCIFWAQANAIADGVVLVGDAVIPGLGCIYSIIKSVYKLGNGVLEAREERMTDYLNSPPLTAYFGSMLTGSATLFLDCVGSITNIGPIWTLITEGVAPILYAGGTASAAVDCNNKFAAKNLIEQNIRGVNSFDPNEITGPEGYGTKNHTSELESAKYTIYFENKDTASAPAQEVFVVDTLDKNMFDVSIFSFNSVTIADTTIKLRYGQTEYAFDLDMRPKQNIIARCTGSIDTITGVVNMYFNSLDATTMEQNENPGAGILLPNVNKPEGEGNVSFFVGLKNVAHGNSFKNKATITFDFNKPIVTNTWINTYDMVAPQSEITNCTHNENDNTLSLNISGTDQGSGIREYVIYVSVDDSAYVPAGLATSETFNYKLISEAASYKFYSQAIDSIGHREEQPDSYDVVYLSTSNKTINQVNSENLNVFPNPTTGNLTIHYHVSEDSRCEIQIYDMQGKQIAQLLAEFKTAGFHQLNFDYANVPNGLYLIKFINDYETFTIKSILSKY